MTRPIAEIRAALKHTAVLDDFCRGCRWHLRHNGGHSPECPTHKLNEAIDELEAARKRIEGLQEKLARKHAAASLFYTWSSRWKDRAKKYREMKNVLRCFSDARDEALRERDEARAEVERLRARHESPGVTEVLRLHNHFESLGAITCGCSWCAALREK